MVSWKAPAQELSGYMIDWTHDGGHFHWRRSNYTNITLFSRFDGWRWKYVCGGVSTLYADS